MKSANKKRLEALAGSSKNECIYVVCDLALSTYFLGREIFTSVEEIDRAYPGREIVIVRLTHDAQMIQDL